MTQAMFRQELNTTHAPCLPFEDQELLEMIPRGNWITPKAAAHALGMDPDAFRAAYCDPIAPRVKIWQRPGPKGGRRVLVEQSSLVAIIRQGLTVPA